MPTSPPSTPGIPLAHHIPTILFLTLTVLVSTIINRTQPNPYIDEIFHIPQAQAFCSALTPLPTSLGGILKQVRQVEYDGKLTTPPGLYAISVGLAKVLPGWGCDDVVWLRGTNLVLLLTLPVLIARILRQNEEQGRISSTPSQAAPQEKSQPRVGKKQKPLSRREIEQLQQKAKLEAPPTPDAEHDEMPPLEPSTVPAIPTGDIRPAAPTLPQAPKRREPTPYITAVACTISFLPPLWFFGFLYYTDLASIWLVLSCLGLYNDLNSPGSKGNSSTVMLIVVTSVMSVLVRQTNIVWVAFAAGQAVLVQIIPQSTAQRQVGLVGEVREVLEAALGKDRTQFWKLIAKNVAPLVPMLAGCAYFVHWNGSIVLGDKTNHQAGLHFPQLGYFLLFSSFFGFFPLLYSLLLKHPPPKSRHPSIFGTLLNSTTSATRVVLKSMFGSMYAIASLTAILYSFYVAVDKFTIDHPFLLADNRHYTFYLWRLFRRTYSLPGTPFVIEPRYVLVPVYAFALFAWGTALSSRGWLFRLLLAGATGATLVPTPLVEVRYYLIPYVLLRIYSQPPESNAGVEMKPDEVASGKKGGKDRKEDKQDGRWVKWMSLVLELVLYASVNVVTVGLFVWRPFEWEPGAVDPVRGEGTTMRFIW